MAHYWPSVHLINHKVKQMPLESLTEKSLKLQDAYKSTFIRFPEDGIIDLDIRIKQRFDVCLFNLNQFIPFMEGIVPPLTTSKFTIALIREGEGEKRIGDFVFPLQRNMLYFIPSRVVQSTIHRKLECEGYMLLFDIDFFLKTSVPKDSILNRKIFKNMTQPFVHLAEEEAQALSDIFESMLHTTAFSNREKDEMMAVKILELLIHCDQYFTRCGLIGQSSIYHPLIQKFNELLDREFKKQRSVQFYASSLNVHPNHLNFLLKTHIGMNAKQHINKKILSESKYLLSTSNFIIKEIANRVGFDDPNNFSTFFQKCTGMSPGSYRTTFNSPFR